MGLRVCRFAVKTRRPACPVAILALGPKGGSSPAALTIRNAKALLTLAVPIILQGSFGMPLTAAAFTECLRPRRCQRRPPGSKTGDTTP